MTAIKSPQHAAVTGLSYNTCRKREGDGKEQRKREREGSGRKAGPFAHLAMHSVKFFAEVTQGQSLSLSMRQAVWLLRREESRKAEREGGREEE